MGYTANQEDSQKVAALFEYIKALNSLRHKKITNISGNKAYWLFSEFPSDPKYIQINYRDRTEDNDSSQEFSALLSVRKPDIRSCPAPKSSFSEWLKPGWNDFRKEAEVFEILYKSPEGVLCTEKPEKPELSETPIDTTSEEDLSDPLSSEPEGSAAEAISSENSENNNTVSPDTEETFEEPEWSEILFDSDPKRTADYSEWKTERSEWADEQRAHDRTRTLFQELFTAYNNLKLEPETLEMIAANGFIKKKGHPTINHPILTRRVQLRFEANSGTLLIEDTDNPSELYTDVLNADGSDLNTASLHDIREELDKNDYHPLDRVDTVSFLRMALNHLTSQGIFSESGELSDWQKENEYILFCDPVFILRNRSGETEKAIDRIIDDIENGGEIPLPILEFINQKNLSDAEYIPKNESIEEQLASVGGEAPEILLCKEANREQLEIAKQIEIYNGVIVQGPPGTGKTHTIANLMGHFLAQGRSVLVTSSTKKALSVLKEKVPSGLQGMIVSILDDSNADMEKSVASITEYVSTHNLSETTVKAEQLKTERDEIIRELANARKKLFQLIQQENHSIVFDGKEYSLIELAKFVDANRDALSYIPDNISTDASLPLNEEEFKELYTSNAAARSFQDEKWQNCPNISKLPDPENFSQMVREQSSSKQELHKLSEQSGWKIEKDPKSNEIIIVRGDRRYGVSNPQKEAAETLISKLYNVPTIDPTAQQLSVLRDGKDEERRYYWEKCYETIKDAAKHGSLFAKSIFDQEIRSITVDHSIPQDVLRGQLETLRNALIRHGSLNFFDRHNLQIKSALAAVQINGGAIHTAEMCEIALSSIELNQRLDKCALYWRQLLEPLGEEAFFKLDPERPEKKAFEIISDLRPYWEWYSGQFHPLDDLTQKAGLRRSVSKNVSAENDLLFIYSELPCLSQILLQMASFLGFENDFSLLRKSAEAFYNSEAGKYLLSAISSKNPEDYKEIYSACSAYAEAKKALCRREEYLTRLARSAPKWARSIAELEGIHGETQAPGSPRDAWNWSRKNTYLNDLLKESESELMKRCEDLSRQYRQITERYASEKAWLNVLKQNQQDKELQSALIGWKQVVKKIGKGTGKRAAKHKAEARILMTKCQHAVPGWIMPISRALESLNCRENKFDVVILDEASQADISALAILYMGKKLIVVGDDKQVSPEAIGDKSEDVAKLQQQFFSGDLEMRHLYEPDTSIYDIAETTFNHLMLKEHFRCVPEIIGFSNRLSYDYRIKPLRSGADSSLLPAVINYRVDGQRSLSGKTNLTEARTIVALMQACLEQSEYEGKTFGVISLLGAEQSAKIQSMIEASIDAKDIEERRILCGTPAHFQGDERDVIFLSMIDSNPEGNGPLSLRAEGSRDSNKKRYNVAVSRAKDQIWVVHSLDSANDLKEGDIRKTLLDYAADPNSFALKQEEIEKRSESPFEKEVADYLNGQGYHLEQQWKVGAYRLDIVVLSGNQRIAIECDGEKFHHGEEKIRADLERQTILERIGWNFIRIRGSEYYLNPKKTLKRVTDELSDFGIFPEKARQTEVKAPNSELFETVTQRAKELLNKPSVSETDLLRGSLQDTEKFNKKEPYVVRAYNSQDYTPSKGSSSN